MGPVRVLPDALGEIDVIQEERVVVRTTRSAPPGSALLVEYGSGQRLELKVKQCRRTQGAELPFRIEGRLMNLSRSERESLLEWAKAQQAS